MTWARYDAAGLPAADETTMREVDRRMVEDLGMDLVRMMENAGRALADVVMEAHQPHKAIVLYGSGGNGGGALVAARHLANRGVRVTLVPASDALAPVPRQQHQIAQAMGLLDHTGSTPPGGDVVVDGMIGYSLRGEPEGRTADLIAWSGRQPAPVVSLDLPTGLSASGEAAETHVSASITVTLGLPKVGMVGHDAVGRLLLADIGIPVSLWRDVGIRLPAHLFRRRQVVHLV